MISDAGGTLTERQALTAGIVLAVEQSHFR